MTAPSNALLAERARQVAEQHPPRSPERRAAAEAWVALATTGSIEAARGVLRGCADASVRYAATRLLRLLAELDDDTTGSPVTSGPSQ